MSHSHTLSNVNPAKRRLLSQDAVASELATALEGLFHISDYRRERSQNLDYTILFCKPTKTIANALMIEKEILAIVTTHHDIQIRTVSAAKDFIHRYAPRFEPDLVIILHSDRTGDRKLRNWGRDEGLVIIPIVRSTGGALPSSVNLRQALSRELFTIDPFQVTGPVSDDRDFFGRRTEAIELLRQLENGRIRSIFGIRKSGKTSLINRVIRLARDSGTPRIAMIDCSNNHFCSLEVSNALRALAKTCKMAANQGYAHIGDATQKTDNELMPVFEDLWTMGDRKPLSIIFDEIDYITPASPTAPHWRKSFNEFWRAFRVLIQEAGRHEMNISVLVSGVSSLYFRLDLIEGVENAALHFIPEEYLSPLPRGASEAMIRDLGRRCGLDFPIEARQRIAQVCGDFPFWIRMAGSHIHRLLDVESRPLSVGAGMVDPMLAQFAESEGADIARVALSHIRRVYPELFETLRECVAQGGIPLSRGRLLSRYGLAVQESLQVLVRSDMIRAGLQQIEILDVNAEDTGRSISPERSNLQLSEDEWAEEIAILSRRMNILERKMRDMIQIVLKLSNRGPGGWVGVVMSSLSSGRGGSLSVLSGEQIMSKLYWSDLKQIISKNWECFATIFGDKKYFENTMDCLNDRPYAHAKPADVADFALQRRGITWLEQRVMQ